MMTLLSILGSVSVLTAAGPSPASQPAAVDWTMFRGERQLRGVAGSDLPRLLAVRWTFESNEAFGSTAAIAGNTVYVGCDDGRLYALNLSDGSVRWKYRTDEAPVQSSPLYLKGTVYFGDDDGIFHAVDARTGKKRWTFATDAQIISSANYHEDRIIFGSYDGTLYCLRADNGQPVWRAATQDRLHATPCIAPGGASGPEQGSPAVLVSGCDGMLHVIDIATGKERRSVELNSVTGSSSALIGDRVVLGTYGNQVLGIDWIEGKVDWTYENAERQFPYMSSAALSHGLAVIGGRDKRVRALNIRTGQQKWKLVTRGRVDGSPVIVDDRVYIGSSDGVLYGLELDSGKVFWRFETGAAMTASPAIGRGLLVIGTVDGLLYCFGRPVDTD